jgi:hypothetical protein
VVAHAGKSSPQEIKFCWVRLDSELAKVDVTCVLQMETRLMAPLSARHVSCSAWPTQAINSASSGASDYLGVPMASGDLITYARDPANI